MVVRVRRYIPLAVWIAALAILIGCESDPGIRVRYKVEKEIWEAKTLERRIASSPLRESHWDVRRAATAYEAILANDPRQGEAKSGWSRRTLRDVDELMLDCKIALTQLYYYDYRDHAAVTYFMTGLGRHSLMLRNNPDIQLDHVGALYESFECDSLEVKCATMFRDVVGDDALWFGNTRIGDTLMTVPVYLARTEVEAGRSTFDPSHVELADSFYTRVIRTWPDSLVAMNARLKRVDLYVMLDRFEEALNDVENALTSPHAVEQLGELRLFKGELLAHGLERYDEATVVFEQLVVGHDGESIAHAARMNLAAVRINAGEQEEGMRMLREIELEEGVPPETATTAMFLRALAFKRTGDRPSALHLWWRICRLYPFTRAAAVAPLLIVRHYTDPSDSVTINRTLDKVGEFYLVEISRDNAYLKHRHVLKDFLIEAYLRAGRPYEAARLLEERAMRWRRSSGSVALLKSAMIYLNLLDDRENGVRILQKCLDVFPDTRYSWVILRQLDRLSSQHQTTPYE